MRKTFDNSYSRLPDRFYSRQSAADAPQPNLIVLNHPLADSLCLPVPNNKKDQARFFSGAALPDSAEPLAMAYAGHQFGQFNPQLGDGRALLIGEILDPDGQRFDIQMKGTGPTPFSRQGDGLAALGPVLREYLMSEAMHALGVPTTRALAAITTGQPVWRDTKLPGAILTRVASSHLRIGTFQYFAARQDLDALRALTDYAIDRHYPKAAEAARPALALLSAVTAAQARLIAHWMQIGFVHGVMNTDNCTISGETIDYGPCAFLDEYNPAKVFSSIDRQGRYAYQNQPVIGQWNLARLAEALLAMIDPDPQTAIDLATPVIEGFPTIYKTAWQNRLGAKFGISNPTPADGDVMVRFLDMLTKAEADFTLSFHHLSNAVDGDAGPLCDLPGFAAWQKDWRSKLAVDAASRMATANPVLIPRNHWIEAVISAALNEDFSLFHEMLKACQTPFDPDMATSRFAAAPKPEERVFATFCGT
ncbi:protein adenylyltransferase SelO [Halovulum sp. GXIMD14793]